MLPPGAFFFSRRRGCPAPSNRGEIGSYEAFAGPDGLSSGADATGLINYSSSVIFTSGNITPTINGNTSNIVPNYTGTCIVE